MLLEIINRGSYINMLLWTIPNYLLSLGIYSYYLSYIPVHQHHINVNVMNIRQVMIRMISNRIETLLIGLVLPLFSIGIFMSHIVNCVIVAEILYSGYDIHSRLCIYRHNLLQISLIGLPVTLLQLCYANNWFIQYHIYNLCVIIYCDWLSNIIH